jgi:AcrR family transcriptional regulator
MAVMEPMTGLRERGKARRRDAIIRAALTLFAEHGYEATTVADIAAAAEVAPRTVALHFPSKQDIALSRVSEAADGLTSALRQPQAGETVTDVLSRWLHDETTRADDDLKQLTHRMFAANPELNALRTARMTAAIDAGAAAIARQFGLPDGSPGPHIAAVATAAVVIQVCDLPPGEAREEAVTTALAFLEAGLTSLRA